MDEINVEKAPYLPAQLGEVTPDVHSLPYWEGCANQELRIQRCKDCATWQHPPVTGCQGCGSFDREFVKVSGIGTVYSFTLPYHPVVPSLNEHVPYNVVVVQLDDAGGVRLISNLLNTNFEDIHIGMGVELVWDQISDVMSLPRFRPIMDS